MIGLIIEFHKLSRPDNQISGTWILIATNYYACGNIYHREIIWTSYFCFYAQYQWNNSSNHQYDECQILASLPQEHLQEADVENEVHLSAIVNKKYKQQYIHKHSNSYQKVPPFLFWICICSKYDSSMQQFRFISDDTSLNVGF